MNETFKTKLNAEREELNIKIENLIKFEQSEEFIKLSFNSKFLLGEQLSAMKTYSDILLARLDV